VVIGSIPFCFDVVNNINSKGESMTTQAFKFLCEIRIDPEKIANIINASFYSVDVIPRVDGEYRIVEIGNGQVSDKKTWNVKDISKMLIENA
jgi:acetoacetate decarboxylase